VNITPREVKLVAIPDIPLVAPGDDLSGVVIDAIEDARVSPRNADVFVVAQKIVSKAEGRYVNLEEVSPSARARELAKLTEKDPRLVEVILSESAEVLRCRPGLMIVSHRLGFVMANAGVDQSNVEDGGDDERVLLLPRDPDSSSAKLKTALDGHFGVYVGVVVNDSVGRAWRNGSVGLALGSAGIPALQDLRGRGDLFGRPLKTTEVGFADLVASAAMLLMGEGDEGLPLVMLRGLQFPHSGAAASMLLRPPEQDLFR
jgi:coenzyme F420-0:L-glutamate ligase/coenzyme F420-1:gamma-L-glutamate ligase